MVEFNDLKKGDLVLVKKGTPIRTTGKDRNKVAGKDYFVTVHHKMRGWTLPAHVVIGCEEYHERAKEAHGIDLDALRKLYETDYQAFMNTQVTIAKDVVVWAGRGGYWYEVDLDSIEVHLSTIELPQDVVLSKG